MVPEASRRDSHGWRWTVLLLLGLTLSSGYALVHEFPSENREAGSLARTNISPTSPEKKYPIWSDVSQELPRPTEKQGTALRGSAHEGSDDPVARDPFPGIGSSSGLGQPNMAGSQGRNTVASPGGGASIMVGTPGERGPVGPQGLTGLQGVPGAEGKTIMVRGGIPGPPGERGEKGDKGERGETAILSQTSTAIIPPQPATGFFGSSLFSATDLSATNLVGEKVVVNQELIVNGSAQFNRNISLASGYSFDPGLTAGSIAFQGATGLTQDNTNLFYNDTNNALGIGTATPASSSILDLTSTTKGLLAPRMTTTQRDLVTSPATGLLIFNTTTSQFNVYDGASWTAIASGGSSSALSALTSATADTTLSNGANNIAWNWQLTAAETGLSFGESAASTGGSNDQYLLQVSTLSASTALPLYVKNLGGGRSFQVDDASTDTTPFVIDAAGNVGIGTASPSNLLSVGTTEQFKVNADGDVRSTFTTLNGSSTSNGSATDGTSLVLQSGGGTNFDVGNYVKVDSTGCASSVDTCYAKITAKSTDTLTISPSLTWANGSAVTEVHIPEIGGVDTSQALASRFGRGYFIDGITTGSASTTYTDHAITWTSGTLSMTGGNVGVGDGSPSALLTVGSGDLFQINSSGAIAAAAGITSSGTVTFSILSAAGVVTNNSSGVLSTDTALDVAYGGTNVSSYTAGDTLYASGSTTLSKLPAGTATQVMHSGTTPSWSAVSMTADVAGTLPVANGGTGAATLTGILQGNGTGAITTVTAPTGSIVGTSDAQTLSNKSIAGGSNTITGVPLVYSNTSIPVGNTIANTTTETTFASSYTLPANTLAVGNVIRVKLWGVYSNAVTPPTVIGKVKLGSTQIATTGTITGGAGASNAGWSAEVYMIIHSTGAGGTADVQGYLEFATAAAAALTINSPNTSTIALDTTSDQAISTTVQWGTASASNTITLRQMIVEILK